MLLEDNGATKVIDVKYFTLHGTVFEIVNANNGLKVKPVVEFDPCLMVKLVLDRKTGIHIGIDPFDGVVQVCVQMTVISTHTKKAWGYVNAGMNSVLFFKDGSVACYSGREFTSDNFAPEFEMLKMVSMDPFYTSAQLMELHVISPYFIACRRKGFKGYTVCLNRRNEIEPFSWGGLKMIYHFTPTKTSPFVLNRLGRRIQWRELTFVKNGKFVYDEAAVCQADKALPLPEESFICIANYDSESHMLAAVDKASPPGSFEFRLYSLHDQSPFIIVSNTFFKPTTSSDSCVTMTGFIVFCVLAILYLALQFL